MCKTFNAFNKEMGLKGKCISLFIFFFTFLFFTNCSDTVQFVKEKAESEEGKQAIEKLKEKINDKETQDKIKGMIGGKDKKSPQDK